MSLSLFEKPLVDFSTLSISLIHTSLEQFTTDLGGANRLHALTLNAATAADAAPAVTNPEEFQNQIAAIRSKLDDIMNRIQQTSANLNVEVANDAHLSIEKLKIAMSKVFDLAVFIEGDYDNREVDQAKKKDLLKIAVAAFEDLKTVAEAGLTKIGDAQTKVTEMEQIELIPQKNQIETIAGQNEILLKSLQDNINQTQNNTNAFLQSVINQSIAVGSLQDKISQTESAATVSDVLFTIFTLGIGNAINHGPLDPFHLHDQLNDAQNRLNDSRNQLSNAANRLGELRNALAVLQTRISVQRQVQDVLPIVKSKVEQTGSQCILLEQRFATLKDSCTRMLLNIRKVEGDAVVTRAVAYTKKEFAMGVLQMALDALIDGSLVDVVEKIEMDVLNNYGSAIPAEVNDLANQIKAKSMAVKALPSASEIK